MELLRCYEHDFEDWGDLEQVELGVQEVSVKDIVGSSIHARKNFDKNWNPLENEYNDRYRRVESAIKITINSKSEPLDLGFIHLFKIYSEKDNKDIYYVCMDGNRRVSNCYRLGVKRILAKITLLKRR